MLLNRRIYYFIYSDPLGIKVQKHRIITWSLETLTAWVVQTPPCSQTIITSHVLSRMIAHTFLKKLEDISPFYGDTDVPVLDFWRCLPSVSKTGWIPCLHVLILTWMDSSDSSLVRQLLTSWWPAWQLSLLDPGTCKSCAFSQALVGFEPTSKFLTIRPLRLGYHPDTYFIFYTTNVESFLYSQKKNLHRINWKGQKWVRLSATICVIEMCFSLYYYINCCVYFVTCNE